MIFSSLVGRECFQSCQILNQLYFFYNVVVGSRKTVKVVIFAILKCLWQFGNTNDHIIIKIFKDIGPP